MAVKAKIRVRIKGYDHKLVDQAADKLSLIHILTMRWSLYPFIFPPCSALPPVIVRLSRSSTTSEPSAFNPSAIAESLSHSFILSLPAFIIRCLLYTSSQISVATAPRACRIACSFFVRCRSAVDKNISFNVFSIAEKVKRKKRKEKIVNIL